VPVQHLEIRVVDLRLAGERGDPDALRVDRDGRLVMADSLPAVGQIDGPGPATDHASLAAHKVRMD
jgi:hypothetical protein